MSLSEIKLPRISSALLALSAFGTLCVVFGLPADAMAHGISHSDKSGLLAGGYWHYLKIGAKHMLTGYDHLLFLFGVVFFLSKFVDIVKVVTAFTVGHCITLLFATLFKVSWNHYLIDALIAISVMFKAFDNNGGFQKVLHMPSPNLLWAVFGFGLLHGFGLSARLQQLPLGHDTQTMIGSILSFNIGVEMGQIAALVVMVGVLSLWRNRPSFAKWSYATNLLLLWLGGALLVMQMHSYWHDHDPDEFRFPVREHQHIHDDMDAKKAEDEKRNTLK